MEPGHSPQLQEVFWIKDIPLLDLVDGLLLLCVHVSSACLVLSLFSFNLSDSAWQGLSK